MTETADLYVSCLRPICFMLAASMFHVCGLYVSCLRPLSTTHGYDKGRIAFWGARKRLGALAVLCGFERWACKTTGLGGGLETSGLGSCFCIRAFRSCFSVVLFVVRAFRSCFSWFVLFGRSFRGSFFWFVLLVVLFVVRALGSCFWGLVCVFSSML